LTSGWPNLLKSIPYHDDHAQLSLWPQLRPSI
jgi:hypothetical protein